MSLEQPDPKLPNPNPLVKKEEEPEEEEKKEIVEDENEEEDEEVKKGKQTKKPGTSKRISVTMYGSITGQYKCDVCAAAHKYFSNPTQWKKFTYKHVDVMSDKGLKVAKQKGFDKMPFFRYRRPGETTDEWIEEWNQKEWEDM